MNVIKVRVGDAFWRLGVVLLVTSGIVMSCSKMSMNHDVSIADSEETSRLFKRIEYARDKVYPALVNIEPIFERYSGGKKKKSTGVGSGVVLSSEGYVITNYHVTRGAKISICTLFTKETVKADLVGEDPLTDLAVIKLRLDERPKGSPPLEIASFGNSDEVEVGEYVLAMGSPLALSQSVSLGIINNADRVFESKRSGMSRSIVTGRSSGLLTKWLQHDASISPGNSGGPLVNLDGEVVGINELASRWGGDMGFAIPSNLAEDVYRQITDKGYVSRTWLGMILQPLPERNVGRGVLLSEVEQNSPAKEAGLIPGDILLSINDEQVNAHFLEELPVVYGAIAALAVGEKVRLEYERDGKVATCETTTTQMEKYKGDEAELKKWGMTIQNITQPFARNRLLGFTDGIVVTGVRVGGLAADARPSLNDDDIIRSIDGVYITSSEKIEEIYKKYTKEKDKREMLLEVWREGENLLSVMETKEEDEEEEDMPKELGRAFFGMQVQVVTKELAEKLGVKKGGVRVTRILDDTPAQKAEVKIGDIIKQIGEQKVYMYQLFEKDLFKSMVRRAPVDEEVELAVLRDGEEMKLIIFPQLEPESVMSVKTYKDKDFEITVRDITFSDRARKRALKGVEGVIVSVVEEAGWAGFGGLHNRDVIMAIDDTLVDSVDKYKRVIGKIKEEKKEKVKMYVKRQVGTYFVFIEPDWEE